jgi:hypothetical protein
MRNAIVAAESFSVYSKAIYDTPIAEGGVVLPDRRVPRGVIRGVMRGVI